MIFRLLRFWVVVSAVFAAVFLLWTYNTAPKGIFKANWTPQKESPFIYGWGPADSIEMKKDGLFLSGARAAFTIKMPTIFKELEFEVVYEEPVASAVIISGVTGTGSEDVEEHILYSRLLEELPWQKQTSEDFTVWESEPSGQVWSEFGLGQIPLQTLGMRVPRPIGAGRSRERVYNISLRGGHTFWIMPAGADPTELEMQIQDMNRHLGKDDIIFEIGDGRRVIKMVEYPDEEEDGTNTLGEIKNLKISLPKQDVPLEIKFRAGDDIFIRQLRTNSARLVFADRIFLGDDVGFGGDNVTPILWTDSLYLRARTPHREGTQTIYFAGRELKLEESNISEEILLRVIPGGLLPIRMEKDDVEFSVSGFIAISPEDFFTPTWPKLDWDASEPRAGAVLARYRSPIKQSNVFVSKTKFNVKDLYREKDGSYNFFIDVPGINKKCEKVNIKQISFTAKK